MEEISRDIIDFMELDAEMIASMPYKYSEDSPLEIKPLTVKQVILIAPKLALILKEDMDSYQEDLIEENFSGMIEFINKYKTPISQILNILGGEDLADKITPEQMVYYLGAILVRMGGKHFPKSISLLQKLSPTSRTGIIAAQTRLKVYLTEQGY